MLASRQLYRLARRATSIGYRTLAQRRAASTEVPFVNQDNARFDLDLFYGVMGNETCLNEKLSADMKTTLLQLQSRARDAVATESDANKQKFIEVAFDAIEWLEELPANEARWFPKHHCFIHTDDGAPAGPLLETVFSHLYETTFTAEPRHTGTAIQGSRGVGKSNILRLVTIVAPVLLPDRVISVYADYKSYSSSMPLPSALLRKAANAANVPDGTPDKGIDSIANVLGDAKRAGRFVVACFDEVCPTYADRDVWAEFHALAASFASVTVVADSSMKLPTLIERADDDHAQLRKWYPQYRDADLPPSLNDDKLQNVKLPPFRHPKQYENYLKARKKPHSEEDIAHLHCITGGRIRCFSRTKTRTTNYDPLSFEHYVMRQLFARQIQRKWDPFNLAEATRLDIADWGRAWAKSIRGRQQDASGIEQLVDTNLLIETELGNYTFGQPNFVSQITESIPIVFLSHATDDVVESNELRSRLEARGVHVIVMEQTEAKTEMLNSTQNWMIDHCPRKKQHRVFLLTDNFVKQLELGDNASIEFQLESAWKAHSDNPEECHKPLFVTPRRFNNLWPDKHKLLSDISDILVVREQGDMESLFEKVGVTALQLITPSV